MVPAQGTFGNVGRNVLTGPGLATWDFSVLKDTHLFERFNLQFRAEIFNLLNRVNLDTPNLIVFTSATATPAQASPVAGTFTQTSTYFKAGAIQFETACGDSGARGSFYCSEISTVLGSLCGASAPCKDQNPQAEARATNNSIK